MLYSKDLPYPIDFSSELLDALDEATHSSDKRVYQTNSGIRAMTAEEAKTATAHLVSLNSFTRALALNRGKLQLEKQNKYSKALQIYASTLGVTLNLNEDQLKYRAEVEGVGYKTANLDEVVQLCKEDFGQYQFQVPAYKCITTFKVFQALHTHGLDVEKKWKEILIKHFPSQSEKDQAYLTKKFTPDFLADCAALRQQIHDGIQNILERSPFVKLDELFETPGLDELTAEVASRDERLMERSTGIEDTKEMANAGGNTSVPNVIPNKFYILNAMKEVVSSIFGERSLKQRLGVGDPTLFGEIPFAPVLLQRMIGERSPQALPKCGVMFTEDCQSKISSDDETTSGITVIQAAYGHNEGVVSSMIPVDTYYINDQQVIIPIIRPKTHRMMPTEKSGELQLVSNQSQTAATTSLSLEALKSLKNFSERLEQYYNGPMDVEFVVDEQEQTIYIVQARPLVKREFGEASYLQNIHQLQSSEILKGSTVGAAGGGLRLLRPSQIISEQTISGALDKYQDSENPQEVEVIVVGRPAASNSHWATVFHNEGKPVIYLPAFTKFKAWLQNSEAYILVSTQQGLVVNLKTVTKLEDLFSSNIAVKGWNDYPAAPLISASFQLQPREKLTDEAIKALYTPLQDEERWNKFQKFANRFDFETFFQRMRTAQGEDLQIGLAALLYKFKSLLKHHAGSLELDEEQQKRLETVQSYALMLARNIKENGNCQPNDASYCRKLLPLHFLHALIFSTPTHDELVDGHSLVTLALQEMAVENAIIKELEEQGIKMNSPYSPILLRLGMIAVREETAKLYRDLVINLDREGREKDLITLAEMLMGLQKLDMLSLWFNISFHKNPDLKQLQTDFKREAPFFKELAQLREILNALNIEVFGQPKSFQTQWQILQKELLDPMKSSDLAEKYNKSNTAGKLACVSLMNRLVFQFDLAIKALEKSNEYSEEKQLILFQTMLKGLSELANQWHQQFNFSSGIGNRLKEAAEVVNKQKLKEKDLRFSEDFDVLAFGSRSGASLGRVRSPKTLEDAFSVIHQELLTMLSILNKNAVGNDLPLTPLLETSLKTLNLGDATGYDLEEKGITLHFTSPLREHGVQYSLISKTDSDKLTLAVRFSAQNENDRWVKIANFMVTLKIEGKFDVGEFDITSRGVSFNIYLDATDNLISLKSILAKIETASTEIAQPRFGIPDMSREAASKVNNDQKGLKPIEDGHLMVEEFEKNCGIENLMSNFFARTILKYFVNTDPAFVEAILKKFWQTKNGLDVIATVSLPKMLLKAGYGASTMATRAMQLLSSKYSDIQSYGINLMCAIAEADVNAIPLGVAQSVFKVLSQEFSSQAVFLGECEEHKYALTVCDKLMAFGKDPEQILEGILLLLSEKKQFIHDNGLKVLELLTKHREHYSDEFRKRAVEAIQPLIPEIEVSL
jgi:hypothetical protein